MFFYYGAEVSIRTVHVHRQLSALSDRTGRDPYSHFLVEERHIVRDNENITLQGVQPGIGGVYIENSENAELFFHLQDLFKEGTMDTFLAFVLRLLILK